MSNNNNNEEALWGNLEPQTNSFQQNPIPSGISPNQQSVNNVPVIQNINQGTDNNSRSGSINILNPLQLPVAAVKSPQTTSRNNKNSLKSLRNKRKGSGPNMPVPFFQPTVGQQNQPNNPSTTSIIPTAAVIQPSPLSLQDNSSIGPNVQQTQSLQSSNQTSDSYAMIESTDVVVNQNQKQEIQSENNNIINEQENKELEEASTKLENNVPEDLLQVQASIEKLSVNEKSAEDSLNAMPSEINQPIPPTTIKNIQQQQPQLQNLNIHHVNQHHISANSAVHSKQNSISGFSDANGFQQQAALHSSLANNQQPSRPMSNQVMYSSYPSMSAFPGVPINTMPMQIMQHPQRPASNLSHLTGTQQSTSGMTTPGLPAMPVQNNINLQNQENLNPGNGLNQTTSDFLNNSNLTSISQQSSQIQPPSISGSHAYDPNRMTPGFSNYPQAMTPSYMQQWQMQQMGAFNPMLQQQQMAQAQQQMAYQQQAMMMAIQQQVAEYKAKKDSKRQKKAKKKKDKELAKMNQLYKNAKKPSGTVAKSVTTQNFQTITNQSTKIPQSNTSDLITAGNSKSPDLLDNDSVFVNPTNNKVKHSTPNRPTKIPEEIAVKKPKAKKKMFRADSPPRYFWVDLNVFFSCSSKYALIK